MSNNYTDEKRERLTIRIKRTRERIANSNNPSAKDYYTETLRKQEADLAKYDAQQEALPYFMRGDGRQQAQARVRRARINSHKTKSTVSPQKTVDIIFYSKQPTRSTDKFKCATELFIIPSEKLIITRIARHVADDKTIPDNEKYRAFYNFYANNSYCHHQYFDFITREESDKLYNLGLEYNRRMDAVCSNPANFDSLGRLKLSALTSTADDNYEPSVARAKRPLVNADKTMIS